MKTPIRIIAIHGAGMNAGFYGALATLMTDDLFQAVNLPGHTSGDQEPPLSRIADMAAWVADHCGTAAGGTRTVLLGHSMGALVALEAAAALKPDAVIAMSAGAQMPVNDMLLQKARHAPSEARQMILKWGFDRAHSLYAAHQEMLGALMSGVPDRALGADFTACNDYADAPAALPCPLLAICGAADKMIDPLSCEKLAARYGGAYVLLPHAGHMAPIEDSAGTAAAIRAFVERMASV